MFRNFRRIVIGNFAKNPTPKLLNNRGIYVKQSPKWAFGGYYVSRQQMLTPFLSKIVLFGK